jgi:hypothetical protein
LCSCELRVKAQPRCWCPRAARESQRAIRQRDRSSHHFDVRFTQERVGSYMAFT